MTVRTVTPDRDTCAFDDCDAEYAVPNAVAGSFCSAECAARDRGRSFLRSIRHDHRFCWSCFRLRKEIERPTDEARRGLGPVTDAALVGYEYHTEHVDMGEHGLECTCGAVDHDIDAWIDRESGPYHWYLRILVEQTRIEGQHEYTFDLETFADEYWAEDDLELALGRALSTPI
jgi:hypothetical protein